jgi:hypothetical protein
MARAKPRPKSKPLDAMTEAELYVLMRSLAVCIEEHLPPGTLFVTVAFPPEGQGRGQYVSNGRRIDIISSMREMADALERKEDRPREG